MTFSANHAPRLLKISTVFSSKNSVFVLASALFCGIIKLPQTGRLSERSSSL